MRAAEKLMRRLDKMLRNGDPLSIEFYPFVEVARLHIEFAQAASPEPARPPFGFGKPVKDAS